MGHGTGVAEWSRLRDWLVTEALPFWENTGFDAGSGLFHERVTMAGSPIADVPRRLMVQARQIYVFSTAINNNWSKTSAKFLESAVQGMIKSYHEADGEKGWVNSIDDAGNPVDRRRDFYAHSFVILALAEVYSVLKDRKYIDLIQETISFLDEFLLTEDGYVPYHPDESSVFSQNPHMHFLEGLIESYKVTKESQFLEKAGRIVDLFERRILEKSDSIIPEMFGRDWKPRFQSNVSSFEPGHHYEWAWLLSKYFDFSGSNVPEYVGKLYKNAKIGHAKSGLIWSEVTPNGAIVTPTFRLWPHTEAVKAAILLEKSADCDVKLGELLNLLHGTFLLPSVAGGWHDLFDEDGRLLVDYIPASSFYHIACAASECEAHFGPGRSL